MARDAAPDWRRDFELVSDQCGVVFNASGEPYLSLAVQAAKSVRATNPSLKIDLFSDAAPQESVFDEVHALERSHRRPKMEAVLRSRFERTLILDADLIVTADVSDVFWVLNHFDLAAAQIQNRNMRFAHEVYRRTLPNAFPQLNSGVMAVRRNDRTRAFFTDWRDRMTDGTWDGKDQPVMRELLLQHDLRVWVLPEEYNFRKTERVYTMNWTVPAPRVLHTTNFTRRAKAGKPSTPESVYGRFYLRLVRNLIVGDRQLTSSETRRKTLAGRLFGRG